MAVGIVTHPLAAVGVLIDVLIGGHSAALNSIQPVPGIALGVIDLFTAVAGIVWRTPFSYQTRALRRPIPAIPAVLRRCIHRIKGGVLRRSLSILLPVQAVNFRFLGGCTGFSSGYQPPFHHQMPCSHFHQSSRAGLHPAAGSAPPQKRASASRYRGHHCQPQRSPSTCQCVFRFLHIPVRSSSYKWARTRVKVVSPFCTPVTTKVPA